MKIVDLTAARAERQARASAESTQPLERLMADLDLGLPPGEPSAIDPYLLRMDPQTGVLGRAALEASLDPAARTREEDDRGGTLLGLRVEGLPVLHELSGPLEAEVLSIVARRLDRSTRLDDGLGRADDDLFALYLRGCGDPEAREVAARCRQAVEGRPLRTDGRSFHLRLRTAMVPIDPGDPRSGKALIEEMKGRMG